MFSCEFREFFIRKPFFKEHLRWLLLWDMHKENFFEFSANKSPFITEKAFSHLYIFQNRSSHQRCSIKKGVLRNFAKFTGKHLCQSLFLNKVAGLTLLTKRLWHRCFPENFVKFPSTLSLQSTSGRLFLSKPILQDSVKVFLQNSFFGKKYSCRSFCRNVVGCCSGTLLQGLSHSCFPWNYVKCPRTAAFQNFSGRLHKSPSEISSIAFSSVFLTSWLNFFRKV